MAIHSQSSPNHRRFVSKLELTRNIVLRTVAIGLISGSILGGLFGCTLFVLIWTGMVGAGLGLGLGLINGIVISAVTCLFFYPLKAVRLYRVVVKMIGASIAGGGAAVFGPWYFASTSMTPSSAVFIGFSSILASVIAGWAGGLMGQNLAHWYEQKSALEKQESTARQCLYRTVPLGKVNHTLKAILTSERSGWISVTLFSSLCLLPGNRLLEFLVCGAFNADEVSCLPSPRLYTSVAEGLKASLPIFLLVLLIVILLQRRFNDSYRH